MVNEKGFVAMHDCMKRRLLYASSQAYQPMMETMGRTVGWIGRPIVIQREAALAHRTIDAALVGRVEEGVVVAFRGTLPPFFGGRHDGWTVLLDWLNDSMSVCVDRPEYGGGVHLGFAESMRRLWDDSDGQPGVRSAIQIMLDRGARRHLFVTGHSKGGALANLCAYRASRLDEWRDMAVSVATIAAARAGNAAFAESYAATRIVCLRYEIPHDLVPHLPPGPHTPAWVHGVARQIWPRLATTNYHPVGTRVSTGAVQHKPWHGARPRRRLTSLLGRARMRLDAITPHILTAHAICPKSGYDQLICTGEDCDHGVRKPGLRLRRETPEQGGGARG
jgi:hypothetical protein